MYSFSYLEPAEDIKKRWQEYMEELYKKDLHDPDNHDDVITNLALAVNSDKKVFFRDQCKEIEENNRMGKTRDLFKKVRDTKGTFHAKMGSIKDRNGMDLTKAEDIKKRWQEYTEEKSFKKGLHVQNRDS